MEFFNLKYLRNSLSELHIHNTIQNFALSLIGVFIPIYFLNIGYSLNQVFWYYIIYYLFFSFTSFFTHYAGKIGFKKIIFLRPIILIISFLWLYNLEFITWSLYFHAIFGGITACFYWTIFHYFFTKKVDKDSAEKSVGLLIGFPKFFALFSPVIGALILSFFSFQVLFIIVSILLFVSIFPLFQIKEYKLSFKFDYKKLFDKSFIKYLFGFIVDGVTYVVNVIVVPLYIYLSFNQALSVGFFSTILNLGGFLTPILISYACKGKTSKYIKWGAILSAISFILIFFVNTQLEFFLFAFLIGTFSAVWNVPFYSRLYKHAKRVNTFEFLILREFFLNFSRVIIFIIILIFGFNITFITNILSNLLFLAF